VDSTHRAAALGDRRWCGLLERYHDLVRRQLGIHRGQELDTAGDGFLAAFDGPARAIRYAMAVRDEVRPLGLEIRAGLHTGECQRIGGKLAGLAVHIGDRVVGLASPAEVLVSSTARSGCRVPGSSSRSAARTRSKAYRGTGTCTLWLAFLGWLRGRQQGIIVTGWLPQLTAFRHHTF
jgi:class 3 adenylate cyclase